MANKNQKPMNYYFITGTSSGIGKALAEKLLEDDFNYVHGLSRRHSIVHERYQHISMDLTSMRDILAFEFPFPRHPQKIVLINNAGQIGDIKPMGKMDQVSVVDLFSVNLTSPALLMNKFIDRYEMVNTTKFILNVSSGAGKKPIEGWAPYCASKAGIDLLSKTVFEEQKKSKFPVQVYSIAPGVVDTKMQEIIRNSNETDFSRYQHFVELKATNSLTSPEEVAAKYIYILQHSEKFPECIFSLRDVEIPV